MFSVKNVAFVNVNFVFRIYVRFTMPSGVASKSLCTVNICTFFHFSERNLEVKIIILFMHWIVVSAWYTCII